MSSGILPEVSPGKFQALCSEIIEEGLGKKSRGINKKNPLNLCFYS